MKGRVIKGVGGTYTLYDGKQCFESGIRGKNKILGKQIAIGDIVEFSNINDAYIIDKIYDRKNLLQRPRVANIDRVIIVIAVTPEPSLELIDKIIYNCYKDGLETILCINKSDSFSEQFIVKISENYKHSVDTIITTSAKDKNGIETLKNIISTGLTCFAGQSAVGKSSLLNCVFGNDILKTGDLSQKANRGKHTTRHSEIFILDTGGLVIDTPGFSLLDIDDEEPQKFTKHYKEFHDYENKCYFTGCCHINEPDCAVKQAVTDGKLSKEKYERYVKMYTEIKNKWRDRYE